MDERPLSDEQTHLRDSTKTFIASSAALKTDEGRAVGDILCRDLTPEQQRMIGYVPPIQPGRDPSYKPMTLAMQYTHHYGNAPLWKLELDVRLSDVLTTGVPDSDMKRYAQETGFQVNKTLATDKMFDSTTPFGHMLIADNCLEIMAQRAESSNAHELAGHLRLQQQKCREASARETDLVARMLGDENGISATVRAFPETMKYKYKLHSGL